MAARPVNSSGSCSRRVIDLGIQHHESCQPQSEQRGKCHDQNGAAQVRRASSGDRDSPASKAQGQESHAGFGMGHHQKDAGGSAIGDADPVAPAGSGEQEQDRRSWRRPRPRYSCGRKGRASCPPAPYRFRPRRAAPRRSAEWRRNSPAARSPAASARYRRPAVGRSSPRSAAPNTTITTSSPARRSTTSGSGAHKALARHQASSSPMLTGRARSAPKPKR